MKKNTFISSALILMVGTLLTRLLGFIIKIIYTRIIGPFWMAEINLVMPSYSLLVTIATLCLPVTLSKLISEKKLKSTKYLANASYIMIIVNFLIVALIISASNIIATTLLKNPFSKYLIISMSLTLPFVSLSSIVKGYFFGKQKMLPYAVSNILEQVLRLILISIFLPIIYRYNPGLSIICLLGLSIITETFSVIIFAFFLPKNKSIRLSDLKFDSDVSKRICHIALPQVMGRLFSNIMYFFEPIILTNILLFLGNSSKFIIYEYSLYNSYALMILLMPSFFIQALSTALIPEISRHQHDYHYVRKIYHKTLSISLILGFIASILIMIFGKVILNYLFSNTDSYKYIKFMAPFFTLYYLEGILISIMQALGHVKKNMCISITGSLIKTILMTILLFTNLGIYPLLISEIIDILYVVLSNIKYLNKIKLNPAS